jgi:hypothetical protein
MMLLFFATMYVLKERSQQAAAPQGKAGTFLSDTSKVGNANDATRIKSLDAIAQAAALYHIEERADLPVSPSYIRLDEANEVSDFFKRALSAYGKPENLLLDPRAPGYYYTYRSLDGMSLELGAHIEDSSSIDCTNQDPCLYRKVLLEEDISKVRQDLDTYKQSF